MLAGIDKGLMWLCWIGAGVAVFLLLLGPRVVAHDSAKQTAATKSPYASGAAAGAAAAPDGKALFKSNCGSCHTLTKAGTSGAVGPKLDDIGLDAKSVEAVMKAGPGAMPSFTGNLSQAEIQAIANFVAKG
jgi:mono/diheme cytochrome c family protein